MPDNHYQNLKLAKIYDIDSPWSVGRDYYLALARTPPQKILDLGCGTGLLCDAYAQRGHIVTGVDPASAMLEVARQKPHGSNIEWVQNDAQDYQSDTLFDLIIMTGHAFQVLLDDKDILATLSVMRAHIKDDGLIVFESRNPNFDWKKNWDYDMKLELPDQTIHESRRFLDMSGDRMRFELRYHFPGEELISQSKLRFLSHKEIAAHLKKTGLSIERTFGDWNEKPFDEKTSQEMIFKVRKTKK